MIPAVFADPKRNWDNDAARLLRVKLTVFEQQDVRMLYDHTATQIEPPDGNGISRRSSSEPLADEPTSGDSITLVPTVRPRQARRTRAVRHRRGATAPKARLADVELRPPPFRSPASLGPYLAAMTCIRLGDRAVCQESIRDPFGSSHPHRAAMTCIRPGECGVCQESMRECVHENQQP